MKEFITSVYFLVKDFFHAVLFLFVVPIVILAVLLGFITGAIWKPLLYVAACLLVCLAILGIVIYFDGKKWEKEQEKKRAEQAERDKVKYIIIK